MNFENIAQVFLSTVEKHSSKELYFYKKNDSWIGLNGQDIKITVEDIAFGLRALGIKERSNVAILSNNSPRWAMCDYGIICSVMTTVTIYPTLLPKQMDFILENSNSEAVFVENNEQLEKIKTISSDILKYIIVMDDSLSEESNRIMNISTLFDKGKTFSQANNFSLKEMVKNINSDDVLTLIYTSGTTGIPKGVVLSHKNLLSNVEATLKVAPFNENETFLSFLPLSHVLERMGGHYTASAIGATIYYAESIEKVPENITETHPTVVICVPRLFEKMYTKITEGLKTAPKLKRKLFYWALSVGKKYSDSVLNKKKITLPLRFKHKIADKLIYSKVKQKLGGRIKFFVSGGAPLSKEIAEFFASVDIMILEGYGLTETSPVLSVNTPPLDIRFGTVGKPLFNVKIKIANDGEILAKGPNIMKGYYNNQEETNKVFDSDGWFKTGDIGEIDNEGFLKITDRKKSLIVTSAGKNIAPAPIEGALTNSAYIEQVLVVGDKRNFISALIVPNFESLTNYLKSINNNLTDPNTLIEHEDTIKLFESEINDAMQDFANYEKVKKFELLTSPFSIERGELTPKMSIIRKKVETNYANLIDKIYK